MNTSTLPPINDITLIVILLALLIVITLIEGYMQHQTLLKILTELRQFNTKSKL